MRAAIARCWKCKGHPFPPQSVNKDARPLKSANPSKTAVSPSILPLNLTSLTPLTTTVAESTTQTATITVTTPIPATSVVTPTPTTSPDRQKKKTIQEAKARHGKAIDYPVTTTTTSVTTSVSTPVITSNPLSVTPGPSGHQNVRPTVLKVKAGPNGVAIQKFSRSFSSKIFLGSWMFDYLCSFEFIRRNCNKGWTWCFKTYFPNIVSEICAIRIP